MPMEMRERNLKLMDKKSEKNYNKFQGGVSMDSVVIIFIVAVLFLLVGVPLIRTEYRRIKDARSAVITVRARVVSKRVGSENTGAGMLYLRDGKVYHATFLLPGGEELELDLSRDTYGGLKEGTWGELTYQGKRYLGFNALNQ